MADTDTCLVENAQCACDRPVRHINDGLPHRCDCGGEWDDDGTIVKFPGGLSRDEALAQTARAMQLQFTTNTNQEEEPTP